MTVQEETMFHPSPLVSGEIKGKPQKTFAPGVIQRLTLQQPLDVAIARTTVRKLADEVGYSLIDQVRLSTAIFEIADKIVTYAGQGEIVIYWRENAGRKGLQFVCNDQGLRAAKLTHILQVGCQDSGDKANFLSLSRIVDEYQFTQDPKYGNCITISIWLE
ncbi:MAG: hypothetical protein JW953_10845 [Anaerolineae bacterium]|nr:hypothetical protein [Anaerolineae bacterium]